MQVDDKMIGNEEANKLANAARESYNKNVYNPTPFGGKRLIDYGEVRKRK